MFRKPLLLFFVPTLIILLAIATSAQAPPTATSDSPGGSDLLTVTDHRVVTTYGKLPLAFEANQGQTDSRVKFLSRGSGYTLFLTPTEAVLSLRKPPKKQSGVSRQLHAAPENVEKRSTTGLRIKLVGANPTPEVQGLNELPGKSNYFIGNDRKKWRTNVPTYSRVKYRNVYPGVDLVYYGKMQKMEHDFIVAPGADPGVIKLTFEGAEKLSLDARGNLVLRVKEGELRAQKPIIYQQVAGARQKIAGAYVLRGPNDVGFEVAGYDHSKPLVIDPVLVYSTYLGGSAFDGAQGMAVDGSGKVYVTGVTSSTNFPLANAEQTTFGGGVFDVFVVRLIPDVSVQPPSSQLVYSTYLGGNGRDDGHSIAVDDLGNAYVTGGTFSSNFPTTPGSFQTTFGRGLSDAFVTKLDPNGMLVYSSYLGGNAVDVGFGIAVDASRKAYVYGGTNSTDFPTTPGSFQTTFGGQGSEGCGDAFVVKLIPDVSIQPPSTQLVYSTYLGGSNDDSCGGEIAVDGFRNVYVTGGTKSTDFPTKNPAQMGLGGLFDAFIAKLIPDVSVQPSSNQLLYSTYLGGSSYEFGRGITVDNLGSAYVIGQTCSTNFPVTLGALQTSYGGGACAGNVRGDVFVAKIDTGKSGLASLIYSTYLGGSNDEFPGENIAVDLAGNAYVTGGTDSADFPVGNSCQGTLGGAEDAFVVKLIPDLSVQPPSKQLVYCTYLGGTGYDSGVGIARDSSARVYVVGSTFSTNFPTTPGAFQTSLSGDYDVFVVKFAPVLAALIQPPINSNGSSIFTSQRGVIPVKFTLTADGSPTCDLPPATISLFRTSGGIPGPVNQSDFIVPADSGSNFRIDTTSCQYVYNLGTSSLGPGTYQVRINSSGVPVGSATFGLN